MKLNNNLDTFEIRNLKRDYSSASTSESFDINEYPCLVKDSIIEISPYYSSCFCFNDIPQCPKECTNLFTELSDEQIEEYRLLNNKLSILIVDLEESIEPVNIKDDCSLQPHKVNLDLPSSRLLARRRTVPARIRN